ncbi:dipeptide ABC transporter ATP-binding protein [Pseudomonas gingeri]|uniref:ABC-type dipeptide transporter n=1 Tax=Pseudomonas gingeri TaxID=117681 RepID=A0A7Y8CMD6_9PSED|nr:ABC transporter ATP-binding protein [Pseudomonas gingeri]NWA02612.1 ABC transporter ATP-binding protein [Pseudomonas gingeri]NWA12215.1 ABC transporter ATP-binding protein [Pseudomonas gingeri]NWA57379.1 ABC transporter ATP-binding protein [Pseudomonas gingeri]NWA93722.1 ABC transporter ATP-binding protein [Pseudomonas gingeri]NWB03194.1 ABC transporter ATP-binding protein [Pseudomonas gingeri]
MSGPLLSIRDLSIRYGDKTVVNNISFAIHPGEVLGVIGESGSGKSLTALAALGLLPDSPHLSGELRYRDTDLMQLDSKGWRRVRGREIAIIFQDPMTSLNPLMSLGAQIIEAMPTDTTRSRQERELHAIQLLREVGLPEPARQLTRFPFELSGGQQQRAMIAMALACDPQLLIADEPTTALDVTTQAQVLALLRDIQQRRGMAMLFISHDLDAVLAMADRVAVMCNGDLLEQGTAEVILNNPQHDYTRALTTAYKRRLSAGRPKYQANSLPVPLVRLVGVSAEYGTGRKRKQVLHDINLQVMAGSTLGIAGESGSGKSTLAKAIMGLIKPTTGSIEVCRMDPVNPPNREEFARTCQYIFQDTAGSLNPRHNILRALLEAVQIHQRSALLQIADLPAYCAGLLEDVGLDRGLLQRFPHQLSGGQRQRVVIARALAMQPKVLVCDEPVSALDATVRNQILDLIMDIRKRRNLTLIFIGHDLAVMEDLADQLIVMQHGRIVEQGDAQALFKAPRSPYTRELLQASHLSRVPIPTLPDSVHQTPTVSARMLNQS